MARLSSRFARRFRRLEFLALESRALLAPVPILHSFPSATKTIFLDFDGHQTSNTSWNDGSSPWPTNTPVITTAAYTIDADPDFSATEVENIKEIFARVAEYFSPFNVDVTTEQPPIGELVATGGSDTHWGVRVAIGEPSPPATGGGGWGFVGGSSGFGSRATAGIGVDTPCFVFSNLFFSPKTVADASAHEVGHTLGLDHDGRTSPDEGYYGGHGEGETSWAPIMGTAYNVELGQWSKGEYANANNGQDDLAIITTSENNGFGYRTDDFDDNFSHLLTGTANGDGTSTITRKGVVERRSDNDWFTFDLPAGPLDIKVTGGPESTMLDVLAELKLADGTLLVGSNPANLTSAHIVYNVPAAGRYYLRLDGVGKGDPLGEGYTDYGSLGQYKLVITYNTPGAADDHGNNAAGATLVAVPSTTSGNLEKVADKDYFAFNAVAGKTYIWRTTTGSLTDTTLTLYGTNGTTQLLFNDDQEPGVRTSRIVWTCPANGKYYLAVRDYEDNNTGTYSLVGSISPNHAPVLNTSTIPVFPTIQEGATNPAGVQISAFANSRITDLNSGALKGIAVIGLTEKTKGTWQFSTNGGTSWTNFGNPTDTAARVLAAGNRVRFKPFTNYFGTPQLKFRAWDRTDSKAPGSVVNTSGKRGGSGAYSTAYLSARQPVTNVNDKPVLSLSGTLGYRLGSSPIVLASGATVTDIDSPNFGGGQLRVRISVGAGAHNILSIGGSFTVDASNRVKRAGIVIGTRVSNGVGTNELKINFNTAATKAIVQELVRTVAYRNNDGSPGQRQIVFSVSDGDGGLSASRTKLVNVVV